MLLSLFETLDIFSWNIFPSKFMTKIIQDDMGDEDEDEDENGFGLKEGPQGSDDDEDDEDDEDIDMDDDFSGDEVRVVFIEIIAF